MSTSAASGASDRPAGVRGADGAGQLVRGDVLEQVAQGAGLERSLHQVVLLVAGEGDDLDVGAGLLDAAGGLGAVHVRHDEVHEDHVRPEDEAPLHCFGAAGGLAHVLEVVEREEERGKAAPDDGMIVDEHDPDGLRLGYLPSPFRPPSARAGTCLPATTRGALTATWTPASHARRPSALSQAQCAGPWPAGQWEDRSPHQPQVSPTGGRRRSPPALALDPWTE